MAFNRKQLSLLKPGLSVSVSVNAKREVKVHPNTDPIMSSLTITPPGSPPGAMSDDQVTTPDPQTTHQQIQSQKLKEANLLTPNASPTHETDAYSRMKASCIYHATPVVKSPPCQPPAQPRVVAKACASVPVQSPPCQPPAQPRVVAKACASVPVQSPPCQPSAQPRAVVNACASVPVQSPPCQPPAQPRAVVNACASVPVQSLTSQTVQGFVQPNVVDEAISDYSRKNNTSFTNVRIVSPQVPTHRHAVVDRIPIVVPAEMEAFEKSLGNVVADFCPQCLLLPGPAFEMDCDDACHRPSTPPNLTVTDYRSAIEDVCKYDMPTLVRARELADMAMWAKREEYSRKSYLHSIADISSDLMDSDGCNESEYDTPDEGYSVQSSALEARLRRRMKKAKRRKGKDAHNKHARQADNSELSAVLLEDVKPRIIVTSVKNNSSDTRVPDLKIHTYIPTDHNSYCAPAKSPKPAPHVALGMEGIVVVKEPNGRLNTTVPGSLPTDSTAPRKILSQVGQRKRTSMPSPNSSLNFKRSKRSPNGKEEPECDPESRAMVAEKKEKHKQSERVRRNKSSLLIKSLQNYIANTCGKNYFKCKNRSENPSKQATVETTVARYMELDNANNNALFSMNSTFTSAVEMLKGLQRRTQNGDQFRVLSQAMKAEADALKVQISERLQLAQTYGK